LTTSICAMTSISFPRYVLATFIGMNVEMPLYVFSGTTLRSIADTTTTGLDTTQWILIAVQGTVIIVLFVVLTVVSKTCDLFCFGVLLISVPVGCKKSFEKI